MICLAYATAGRARILAGASRGSAWLPADDSVTPLVLVAISRPVCGNLAAPGPVPGPSPEPDSYRT